MTVQIDATVRALDEMVDRVMVATDAFVRATAEEIQRQAAANAPHRSGALAQSIEVQNSSRLAVYTAMVGPTALPYARRMELGFHRRDKKGRVYHQAGHGFFRKAEREVMAKVGEAIADVWGSAIRG